MPDVQEVFRMATQKVRPDEGFRERQHDHRRRKERNRKIGAFVVVAAIALVAAAAIVANQPGSGKAPATDGSADTDLTSLRAARNFANAYGAFDADEALVYLAPDADISGLLFDSPDGAVGAAEELRLQVRMLEAEGFRQLLGDCEQTFSSSSGADVTCAFDFHAMGSDELGLGPYAGSSYDFRVQDGLITRASVDWGTNEFSPQVWEPFADWVSTTHPEDAAVMYQDETYSGLRLSRESIALWQRRVSDYVAVQTPDMVQVAQRFMEARNAYDAEAILALLPEDGASIRPMDHNVTVTDLLGGRVARMDREQLALAFEAERLFQVQYGSVECRSEPSVHYDSRPIECTYVLDGRLRQIAGIDPAPKIMRIGVRDGLVTQLSFPWLNVGFPSNAPAESWAFVEWLQDAHPEAGAPMQSGTLYEYRGGQEMRLILTPESLQLLATYLDEYEAAVG